MLEAAKYYDVQAPGLGSEFLAGINLAVNDIGANPKRWPVVSCNIRRRLIHRFPYCLLYRIDGNKVVVLAIMHLRRRPDYWTARL